MLVPIAPRQAFIQNQRPPAVKIAYRSLSESWRFARRDGIVQRLLVGLRIRSDLGRFRMGRWGMRTMGRCRRSML